MADELPTTVGETPETCPVCHEPGGLHIAAIWSGRGWHAFQICIACHTPQWLMGDGRARHADYERRDGREPGV